MAPPGIEVLPRADGGAVLKSPEPLGTYAESLSVLLERAAATCPNRTFVARRDEDGAWCGITYGEARDKARRLGQALLDLDCGPERPVMVLSGNSVEHALLTLACTWTGIPIAPVSPAYSLMSGDFERLRYVVGKVRPGVVFVQSMADFLKPLAALDLDGIEVVAADCGQHRNRATAFERLLATEATDRVDDARGSVTPDTVAKYLFSSGSTGQPKAVINTHRMLCSNQQALRQVQPVLTQGPVTIVDWLPWNHTFGGNHNFNLVLNTAGTLYIDDGKPLPGLFETSVRNNAEIRPNVYLNVPAGFDMLVQHLENDADLRRQFFSNLKLICYAAAALPQGVFDRLSEWADQAADHEVTISTGYGSTETAPLATAPRGRVSVSASIGGPVPGTEIRLAPVGDKLEVRVKGPNVTPGYLGDEKLTRAAFDDEGFYRMGDAARFLDPARPELGLRFDGRIAEDFKLLSGVWVSAGALRVALVNAGAPLIRDLVATGHDRHDVGALIWLNEDACRECCGPSEETGEAHPATDPRVLARLRNGIEAYNETCGGTSRRLARALILTEPPSVDAGEMTDKGYINQSAVLARRAAEVAELHADPPSDRVLLF